jgi:chromosome segregation ATPase
MTTTATDAALTAMRICTLVQDLEYTRKKAHDVLLNYKTDLLAEKRSEIRELEKEIAQAADDKDATDDERDNVELEIDALENEVRDLEEQIREHNRSSSMQNGRINVAHQRKKRRLDADLERMFELIEQKRMEMTRLEKESAEKGKERDKLEASMIDLEKELVQILVEQMKVVLGHLDAGKGLDEKLQEYASDFGLPWPPYRHPQHKDVPPLTDVKKIPPLVYDKYA